jgi:hypothetical protein
MYGDMNTGCTTEKSWWDYDRCIKFIVFSKVTTPTVVSPSLMLNGKREFFFSVLSHPGDEADHSTPPNAAV